MLLIGLSGLAVQPDERRQLTMPQVSGVVLFARNFASLSQLQDLIGQLRALREDEGFIICVDQEGGPVQRFRDGFTRLPALARLGAVWDRDPREAVALAEDHAWLMASELRAVDVDLSFAPVLDLARGNRAIGERAFHADPAAVSELGQAYVRGMHLAGMAVTLKHFPGHGSVLADTHHSVAIDPRDASVLRHEDMRPFREVLESHAEAVMMAHVVYPTVDTSPAGQSTHWIKDILRTRLSFHGVVISDDISMAAAGTAGDIAARIHAHHDAGCDLILACQPDAVAPALAAVQDIPACDGMALATLRGMASGEWAALMDNPQHRQCAERLEALDRHS